MSAMLDVEGIQTYYGESHVLHGVTLHVGTGEAVALLGRNGAGKTTVIRSIVGFTPPRAGRIVFDGTPDALRKEGKGDIERAFHTLTGAA